MQSASSANILIFRRGYLGDTLVALPALAAVRRAYPRARIVFVGEWPQTRNASWAEELFAGTDIVDEVVSFKGYGGLALRQKAVSTMALLRQLRGKGDWTLGIALDRGDKVRWEPALMRFLKCKRIISPRTSFNIRNRKSGSECHVSDQLLHLLKSFGFEVPLPGTGDFGLKLSPHEHATASEVLTTIGAANVARPWIAVGPWSSMRSKMWPIDRYIDVLKRLMCKCRITPFVFGGAMEAEATRALVSSLGFGHSVAGLLNVRESIALMSRCSLFLGCDSGGMHLAVSAGLPCVAMFSARDVPGRWYPYGSAHVVLRKSVPCEGCKLRDCITHRTRCLTEITVDEVYEATLSVIERVLSVTQHSYLRLPAPG